MARKARAAQEVPGLAITYRDDVRHRPISGPLDLPADRVEDIARRIGDIRA